MSTSKDVLILTIILIQGEGPLESGILKDTVNTVLESYQWGLEGGCQSGMEEVGGTFCDDCTVPNG